MLRRCGLLVVALLLCAGCGIHWERTSIVHEAVLERLHEEFGATNVDLECIKREAQGAEYECRGEDAKAHYHCDIARSIVHRTIKEMECEREPLEEEHAPGGGDEHTTTAEHEP